MTPAEDLLPQGIFVASQPFLCCRGEMELSGRRKNYKLSTCAIIRFAESEFYCRLHLKIRKWVYIARQHNLLLLPFRRGRYSPALCPNRPHLSTHLAAGCGGVNIYTSILAAPAKEKRQLESVSRQRTCRRVVCLLDLLLGEIISSHFHGSLLTLR